MNETPEQPLALVIDDDLAMRMLLRATLEQDGLRVEEAEDGASGLARFDALRPDIVVLDVVMPRMDGFAVCTQLRQRPHGLHAPVLMLTGLDDVDSINRAYQCGATDFITKPIPWPILPHRVRYLLRASQTLLKLARSQVRLADAQRMAQLGNWCWEVERDRFTCSAETLRILGIDPQFADASLAAILALVHPVDRARVEQTLRQALERRESCDFDTRVICPDGTLRNVYVQAQIERGERDHGAVLRGTLQDRTEHVMTEERIRYLAYYDDLTGLPNRAHFRDHLAKALAQARASAALSALLFLDLDRFKRINDTFGHSAGDQLLNQVTDRLTRCLRSTDCVTHDDANATAPYNLARLGGDEFIVLLHELRRPQDAAKVARRIIEALTAPFAVAGQELQITTSIGIALFPDDGEDGETLLKNADAAMYHAKAQGRNNYQFYDESLNAKAFEKLALESGLRKALERGEMVLHFQPQVDELNGRIAGVEALVRWQHPELGLVPPADFIPLAEESGLIVPLGEWVLRAACAQNKSWQEAGLPLLCVAVNVSSPQFDEQRLVRTVAQALEETGLDPACLELEVTESVLIQDIDVALRTLQRLKEMGVRLAIDDFGTGYSSLSYLKRFPVDALKIDRSFVRDVIADPDDAAITSAIIALARTLDLQVIAEGVETAEQSAFLRQRGCHLQQGYLFSRPLPAEEFARYLRERDGHGDTGCAGTQEPERQTREDDEPCEAKMQKASASRSRTAWIASVSDHGDHGLGDQGARCSE